MGLHDQLHGLTRQIPLSKGYFAIVDADDYEWLSRWKWHALVLKNTVYARRTERDGNGKRKAIYMHNLIMQTPQKMHTDHINGNGLNNRRGNLRVCKHVENLWRCPKARESSSQYKGVHYFKQTSKWQAYIKTEKGRMHLGYFDSEHDAAQAYNAAALKYRGEYAYLNVIKEEQAA